MDLNEYIYRDDTADVLGAETDADDFVATEEAHGFVMPAKLGLAAIGGALVGISHLLGHSSKH